MRRSSVLGVCSLTYCDVTNGPSGEEVSLAERIEAVGRRRGSDSLVYQAMIEARGRYEAAIESTLASLRDRPKMPPGGPAR